MGWQEKLNPKSMWYKRRHPQVETKLEPKEFIKTIEPKKSLWRRIVNKIREFLCLPKTG
jgi:hypothetical protein